MICTSPHRLWNTCKSSQALALQPMLHPHPCEAMQCLFLCAPQAGMCDLQIELIFHSTSRAKIHPCMGPRSRSIPPVLAWPHVAASMCTMIVRKGPDVLRRRSGGRVSTTNGRAFIYMHYKQDLARFLRFRPGTGLQTPPRHMYASARSAGSRAWNRGILCAAHDADMRMATQCCINM